LRNYGGTNNISLTYSHPNSALEYRKGIFENESTMYGPKLFACMEYTLKFPPLLADILSDAQWTCDVPRGESQRMAKGDPMIHRVVLDLHRSLYELLSPRLSMARGERDDWWPNDSPRGLHQNTSSTSLSILRRVVSQERGKRAIVNQHPLVHHEG
jgi:hypothetical protein